MYIYIYIYGIHIYIDIFIYIYIILCIDFIGSKYCCVCVTPNRLTHGRPNLDQGEDRLGGGPRGALPGAGTEVGQGHPLGSRKGSLVGEEGTRPYPGPIAGSKRGGPNHCLVRHRKSVDR